MNWHEAMEEARAHGITRAAMAAPRGVHPDTLVRWERDERYVQPEEKHAFDKALRRLGEE